MSDAFYSGLFATGYGFGLLTIMSFFDTITLFQAFLLNLVGGALIYVFVSASNHFRKIK